MHKDIRGNTLDIEEKKIQNAIDKRIVNILKGMTFSIVVLAGSIVWWAAEMNGRVSTVENGMKRMQDNNERVAAETQSIASADAATRAATVDRLSRLETDYLATKVEVARRLSRVEDKLDVIIERLPRPRP